jgi:glutathione S-transferase
MTLRLTYFDFPFWRAETSRLALHIGGVPFEDVRPDRETFRARKAEGGYPYGQLPVLEVDGVAIAQSAAIAVYCGKLAGLYPIDDALMAAKVDELLATANQISYLISPTMRERDPEKKRALRVALGEETLPQWFAQLDARLTTFGPGPYCVGEQLSVADLAIWRMLDWLTSGLLDGVPTTLLEPHVRLQALCDTVASREDVQGWMARYHKG